MSEKVKEDRWLKGFWRKENQIPGMMLGSVKIFEVQITFNITAFSVFHLDWDYYKRLFWFDKWVTTVQILTEMLEADGASPVFCEFFCEVKLTS